MCIRTILKEHEIDLNYNNLILKITPICLNLLSKFSLSNVLWPIVEVLTLLIQKS